MVYGIIMCGWLLRVLCVCACMRTYVCGQAGSKLGCYDQYLLLDSLLGGGGQVSSVTMLLSVIDSKCVCI